MKRTAITALAFLMAAIGTADADPGTPFGPSQTSPASDPPAEWSKRDWIMAPLYGSLGAGGLGFGLGALGYQVDGHCLESANDCVPALTAGGAYTGLVFGAASAVTLYGKSRGLEGGFGAAMLGAVAGNVASGLPIALGAKILGDDLGPPFVLAALVAGPAIGATIGYRVSYGIRKGKRAEAPRSGALVSFDGKRASLSVPALAIGVEGQGLSIYAPLAAGTF